LLAPAQELPELPQISAVGDPAGLLRRRPDIRVAERELAASTARVGVAVGDLFPKVTFNGSFTYAGTEPASLGSSASRGYVIGPAISWAALDLGRVQARIAQSHARADVALAGYEQTVLRALERSEEHTSELQSPYDLVCRLLLEKKKNSKLTVTRQPCQDLTA